MISRRTAMGVLGGALTFPWIARAQQPPALIGYLGAGLRNANTAAFLRGMRELGYIDGQNIRIEYRFAEGALRRLPDLAQELVRLSPRLIVASSGEAGLACRQATDVIPIVLATAADPLGSGLVESLSHPGGNVTGLKGFAGEVASKQLGLLHEAVPTISRVGILVNTNSPSAETKWIDAKTAAASLLIDTVPLRFSREDALGPLFGSIPALGIDGLLVPRDPTFDSLRSAIVEAIGRARVPAVYGSREFVDAGGLMSYANENMANYHRAATYVDKILRGTKPADLPVEQAKSFALIINLKSGHALGLTIPPSLLARADEVIE